MSWADVGGSGHGLTSSALID